MKIYYSQLQQQLGKGLVPVYVLSGTEQFLLDKAVASIEKKAAEVGFTTRCAVYTDAAQWDSQLTEHLCTLDLFAARRVVNLCIQSKPNKSLNDTLARIFSRVSWGKVQDLLLLVRYYGSLIGVPPWLKPLGKQCVQVQNYPLMPSHLPGFVREISQSLGLRIDAQAVSLLIAYTEGNLHALDQELGKLSLVFGEHPVQASALAELLRPDQRFHLFDLSHAVLAKQTAKALYILRDLLREGELRTLILWTLTQDVYQAWQLVFVKGQADKADKPLNIWPKKLKQLKVFVQGMRLVQLQRAVQAAYQIDLILKGADALHDADYQLERLVVYLTRAW